MRLQERELPKQRDKDAMQMEYEGLPDRFGQEDAESARLRERIARLRDTDHVDDLMARYCDSQRSLRHLEQCTDLFALREPDVSVRLRGVGQWTGANEVQKWCAMRARAREGSASSVRELATPYIVVAQDGATARGVWSAPGYELFDDEHLFWSRVIYAVDFTRQDEEWKIWHLCICPQFHSAYRSPWTRGLAEMCSLSEAGNGRSLQLYWSYSTEDAAVPVLPASYRTFEGQRSF
jgi:hypothetical protein